MTINKNLRLAVPGKGDVSALLTRPANARYLLVLAHGAGAGMTHPFLESLTAELTQASVAVLRYQFPYMENRRGAPDRPDILTATVKSAVDAASHEAPDLPLFAGGKSMGGRMSSQAAASGLLPGIKGIVFFGFPLHAPNQPGIKRADHLSKVKAPMLFLQGTRDAFADLKLIRSVCKRLGRQATLHLIETADHSFHVLKSSGKTDSAVLQELAQETASWMEKIESTKNDKALARGNTH
ncbi:MAG TPA: alpha/beta family hydrolase [Candidatus Nitrosotalea sp.]|nr:alpha/beta family hydrolase [Candidatus Nitrosotalea sp.]